ncbi:LRR receptor-like serine/threonine-protein kinase EFR [Zea mays]|uniref:non-specific serine/threonine protein kinase n=2 Tax=Zea mays TaxID=4577 RepID=A0A1D6LPV1_MAIZE|nr:LRR receptor-like serine/threonine-protein kinase EFR [Zea mays]
MAAERACGALLLVVVALMMRLAAGAEHENNERDALRAFWAGVSSDPSGALRSWNSTAHFCRWAGVSCIRGHVVSLQLSYLGLVGTISPAIGNLTYLELLDLNRNQPSGSIPSSIGRLRRLTYLGLCDNGGVGGEIPDSLRNCTGLTVVYLNNNSFVGGIPTWLGTFQNLSYLYLSQNSLSGEIPPSLGNLTKLQILTLDQNLLEGPIPEGLSRLSSMQVFDVHQNSLRGEIPPGFFNLSSLQQLNLASNAFHGRLPLPLPPDSGARMSNLRYLLLGGNRLAGPIPAAIANASGLATLSLANNSFSGQVPPEFSGTMPASVGNLSKHLKTLGLANNRVSGPIPPGIGNLVALQRLRLQSNRLSGAIPEAIGNLRNLSGLWLQDNKLAGPLPSSIGNLTQLLVVDLSSNRLNGSIPRTLANLQLLTSLNLSGNALAGPVPSEIFSLPSLSLALDLSGNQLDGPLPSDVSSLVNLAQLVLSGNQFSGELPDDLGSCQSLELLALDRNLLDGSIPPSLSGLKGLRTLNLTGNMLSGSIPPKLGDMSGLQELCLSRNRLTGTIPEELENASSLVELDLSYNDLDGRVPARGVFANVFGLKIAGNGALCGGVPQLGLPRCPAAAASARDTHRFRLLLRVVAPVLSVALLSAAILLLAILQCWWKTTRRAKTAAPDVLEGKNYQRVSYAELAKATNGFAYTNLIGAGKFGSVYLGALPLTTTKTKSRDSDSEPESVAVAVKVFDLSQFMPNYSLDRWLHPGSRELDKDVKSLSVAQRLSVALDIADALSYLHTSSVPPIIHCDLKPSNVLLGEDMTALIGDFGLAKLLLDPGSDDPDPRGCAQESTIGIRGTIGYVAPEYGTTGKVTTHGDVYSFGVTLLEIFTGRSPADGAFEDGLTLVEFVGAALLHDKIEQVVDPALLPAVGFDGDASRGSGESGARVPVHNCLVSALRVGLRCTRAVPYGRLSMTDAASELRAIRDACAVALAPPVSSDS